MNDRLELEVDDVRHCCKLRSRGLRRKLFCCPRYLRSIGLKDEADALEKASQAQA